MRALGLIVLLFLSSSCAFRTDSERNLRTEFALAAVEDNILTTDYTALVKITGVATGVATGDDDLLAVEYTATVLESYSGEAQTRVVFTEYVGKSERVEDSGRGRLIVSLCRDIEGKYYLPDIGFELPAQDVIVNKAREIRALIGDKKLSTRRDDDSYACVPM